MKGVALVTVLLLLAACNEEDDLSSRKTNSSNETMSQDQAGQSNVVADSLSREVGPIEIHFTLNRKNEAVTTVVAEGETRLLTMQMETAEATETHEEKVHTASFSQPWLAASDITESFTLANKGIIDILMVIDDSDSMQNVHTKLKDLVNGNDLQLLNGVEHSSWQLALADIRAAGCLRAVVDKNNVANYLKFLQDIGNADANRESKHERAIYKANKVLDLNNNCRQAGALGVDWLRQKSTLAVIVVTDEDHQCYRPNKPDSTGDNNTFHCDNIQKIKDKFTQLTTKGKVSWLKLYGIMDETNTCGAMRNDKNIDASRRRCYARRADMSRCTFTNPCALRNNNHKLNSANFAELGFDIKDIFRHDYAGIFSEIMSDIEAELQDRFLLKARPKENSLTVEIDGKEVHSSLYTIDRDNHILQFNNNSLQTLTAGLNNPTVSVSYQADATPDHLYQFDIDSKADIDATGGAALTLSINGVEKVIGTHYRVERNNDDSVTIELLGNDANRKLLFPEGATATVTYRELLQHYPPLVLQQPDIDAKSIRVYVDGVATTEFTIGDTTVTEEDGSVAKKTVVFNDGHQPQHEQVVKITYTYYTATQKLSYDDNVQDKYTVTAESCAKSSDRSAIPCRHENGMITFSTDDFERGLEIIVNMTVEGLEKGEILVPDNLVAGSLLLTMDGESRCDKSAMVINDGIINLTSDEAKQRCPFLSNWNPTGGDDIKLSYQTYIPNQEVEVINSAILSHTGSFNSERWEVYLRSAKKEEGDDYEIKGRKVIFKGQLDPDTKGKVDVYLVP